MIVSITIVLDAIKVDEGLRNEACGEPQAWLAYPEECRGILSKQIAQVLRSTAIK
jgi:hypothetical protein